MTLNTTEAGGLSALIKSDNRGGKVNKGEVNKLWARSCVRTQCWKKSGETPVQTDQSLTSRLLLLENKPQQIGGGRGLLSDSSYDSIN